MQRFEGKVALVTGAASGIGRATAIRLAEEGALVMLADIDREGMKATKSRLSLGEGRVEMVVFDACDPASCRQAVERTVATFGRLDVLCNIAGIALLEHLTKVREEQWNKMVAINMSSVFFLSQAAMPHLMESKGNIVNMASSAGLFGQAYGSVYCATKGAVVLLSKSMAAEFGDRGVRVNVVCPGPVDTPINQKISLPENHNERLLSRLYPLLEPAQAQPEEIAGAVAYLASDEARFVTGCAFSIDGAQTAW